MAIAVNMQGNKEVLGLWAADNEGAKFYVILTDIENRGAKDFFIACVDGPGKAFRKPLNRCIRAPKCNCVSCTW